MDDIQLPPLPPAPIFSGAFNKWADDIRRAAVIADRERRKPERVVHRYKLYAARQQIHQHIPSIDYSDRGGDYAAVITLCWTDDGRAWIDSEKNRELAKGLRHVAETSVFPTTLEKAADALDGGG